MDALIIGAYYGTGVNGGKVSQYLLGIAVPNPAGGCPNFVTFTKVRRPLQLLNTLSPMPPPFRSAIERIQLNCHNLIAD